MSRIGSSGINNFRRRTSAVKMEVQLDRVKTVMYVLYRIVNIFQVRTSTFPGCRFARGTFDSHSRNREAKRTPQPSRQSGRSKVERIPLYGHVFLK